MNYIQRVYDVVGKIPEGKVMTYGEIAKKVREIRGVGDVRGKRITANMIGWALHKNKDPEKVPCHRVVKKDGKIAKGYAFGGEKEQKRKLEKEGVFFKDKEHVDLEKCAWNLSKVDFADIICRQW